MDQKHQEVLQQTVNEPCTLPDSLLQEIADRCQITVLRKKEHLAEKGNIDRSEYFLLEGVLHRYVLTEKGDFITTDFYLGPDIIMPNFARTSGGVSLFSLQALTPLVAASIDTGSMDTLKQKHPEILKWFQKVVEVKLQRNFVEQIRFRSSTARERLHHLRREFPNLENMIPHTCIASYVGVTPVSLSRLRRDLAKSN